MSILQSGITKSLAESYEIDNSLRFNDDEGYLKRTTLGTSTNPKKGTLSFWYKYSKLDTNQVIFSGGTLGSADQYDYIGPRADNGFDVYGYDSWVLRTGDSNSMVFRDTASWYHICIAMDSTQSTEANRGHLYVNGEEVAYAGTTSYPSLNLDFEMFDTGGTQYVGARNDNTQSIGGYLAEFYYIDGQQLLPSDFGELDSTTNQWIPKDAKDDLTFGTNGFYQKYGGTGTATSFEDSSASDHTITRNGDVINSRAQKKIGDSSILFDGTGDSLELAASSDWDFGTGAYTVEGWIKTSDTASQFVWHGAGAANTTGFRVRVQATDGYLNLTEQVSGDHTIVSTTAVNDGNWHHWAVSRVASEDSKMFIDGVHEATMDDNYNFDNDNVQMIGIKYGGNEPFDGYMDEIRVSNSARYTANFTPSTTAFTPDSNTKFLLHSNFDGGLGLDSSGEGNNFTPTNLVATDQMIDTPTNNFCTLNPIVGNAGTMIEGNLVFDPTTAWHSTAGTFSATSGKWYFEYYIFDKTNNGPLGVRDDAGLWDETGGPPGYAEYGPEGSLYRDGLATIASVGTLAAGDIVGVAVNMDDGEIQWFKNGAVLSGSGNVAVALPTTTQSGFLPYLRAYGPGKYGANFGQDSSFAGTVTAQGNQDSNGVGDFYYTPPSGYLALCTDNLSAPEIKLPGDNFNTVKYDGNGWPNTPVTNVITTGMAPDWVWLKSTTTTYWNQLYDSVRGPNLALYSNETDAEYVDVDALMSFDSTGFTLGAEAGANDDAQSYVSWSWKAGGAPTADNSAGAGATPTAGSVKIDGSNLGSALAGTIPATRLSANTTAGFSIVEYSGVDTPSTNTVAHGLSVTPELYIIKNMTSASPLGWIANTTVIDGTVDYLVLNTGAAAASQGSPWSTLPTASVFTLGANDGNTCNDGDDYIAYCFHSVEGYSKVGSYIGNGNTDGVFIYTGFKPAFIIGKNTTEADYAWWLVDTTRSPHNIVQKILSPQANSAETDASYEVVDIVSNGFKFRIPGTDGNLDTYNGTDDGYLYIAFASHPFKTSNAR